ncbi:hypothetical protein ON010_g11588 [Phytophthora cinnamomi]|nr:hypothetical protein ON010_g11588 [Phytophthora cinnamomi]
MEHDLKLERVVVIRETLAVTGLGNLFPVTKLDTFSRKFANNGQNLEELDNHLPQNTIRLPLTQVLGIFLQRWSTPAKLSFILQRVCPTRLGLVVTVLMQSEVRQADDVTTHWGVRPHAPALIVAAVERLGNQVLPGCPSGVVHAVQSFTEPSLATRPVLLAVSPLALVPGARRSVGRPAHQPSRPQPLAACSLASGFKNARSAAVWHGEDLTSPRRARSPTIAILPCGNSCSKSCRTRGPLGSRTTLTAASTPSPVTSFAPNISLVAMTLAPYNTPNICPTCTHGIPRNSSMLHLTSM